MASILTFNKINIGGTVYDKDVFVVNSGRMNINSSISKHTTDDGYIHSAITGNLVLVTCSIHGNVVNAIEQGRGQGVVCKLYTDTDEHLSVTGIVKASYNSKSRTSSITIKTNEWTA